MRVKLYTPYVNIKYKALESIAIKIFKAESLSERVYGACADFVFEENLEGVSRYNLSFYRDREWLGTFQAFIRESNNFWTCDLVSYEWKLKPGGLEE